MLKKYFLLLLILFPLLSCSSASPTSPAEEDNLVGGTEVGNPPSLRLVEGSFNLDDAIIVRSLTIEYVDCTDLTLNISDEEGFQTLIPINSECTFSFQLEANQVYSWAVNQVEGEGSLTFNLSFFSPDENDFINSFELTENTSSLNFGIIRFDSDNERFVPSNNPLTQVDEDNDGANDETDIPNSDNDFIPDQIDNCDLYDNNDQADFNNDGIGDACDKCINTPNGIICG